MPKRGGAAAATAIAGPRYEENNGTVSESDLFRHPYAIPAEQQQAGVRGKVKILRTKSEHDARAGPRERPGFKLGHHRDLAGVFPLPPLVGVTHRVSLRISVYNT